MRIMEKYGEITLVICIDRSKLKIISVKARSQQPLVSVILDRATS